ncbi:hypothetical protein BJ508DRAFT_311138 [Ascobolus immersus RN42]|uniref:Uncharacterized protein n=1 Tax=Ascobolus immersus RN42 TaxID=1160509 RepID=A0A3N4HTR0_ASCIM|nr:hypothetical protein BJ508DRAFT_311138 [Ascobolus immersus RN42]
MPLLLASLLIILFVIILLLNCLIILFTFFLCLFGAHVVLSHPPLVDTAKSGANSDAQRSTGSPNEASSSRRWMDYDVQVDVEIQIEDDHWILEIETDCECEEQILLWSISQG